MENYDLILTASTFRSTNVALNFLRSTTYLGGRVLPIMVSPLESDLSALAENARDIPAVYIKSDINSLHFGRAWGFVWAINNGITGRYLMSCDDDIQFYPSANKIIERLNKANENPSFSLMAFSSNHPAWASGYYAIIDKMRVGVQWVDGNCICSKWQDNLDYGVIDGTLGSPLLYYVELEYCHRMRFLTGRPIIFDQNDVYYHHVFRSDPELNSMREGAGGNALMEGQDFWAAKFGMRYNLFSEIGIHERIYNETTQNPMLSANYRKFIMFGGCWNDWAGIYARYSPGCKVMYDTRS